VALLYEGMGIILGYTVKQFFWVPHRFRYGIIVAGGWGNVGDIRGYYSMTLRFFLVDFVHTATSVIMSVTGAAPFMGTEDQTLAVAYISVFILVFLARF